MSGLKVPRRRWESRCVRGWDTRTADHTRSMQDTLLERFIREQIYPFHPHYRRVFDENGIDPGAVRTVDDLTGIPFTRKEDIAPSLENPYTPRDFVLDPLLESRGNAAYKGWIPVLDSPGAPGADGLARLEEEYRPVVTMFTTGRTAEPTPFFFTGHDLARMREAGRRLAAVVFSRTPEGSDSRAAALNNFPGVAHLAYWVALTGAEGSTITMVSTGGGATMGNERILNVIERATPSMFMGLPGYTYDLFKKAAAEGRDLSSIEVVVMGGDRITAGSRERISEMLEEMGAVRPVVTGAYGCTEMKYAWGDCGEEEGCGYHTYPDMEVIEVIDPETGRNLGEGETGELVVTNLDARGSVVLRYRTGDILDGGFTTEPCPSCGRTVPRISARISRGPAGEGFALSKVKGNLIDLNSFSEILDNNVEVLEWHVEIRKRNDDPEDIDEISIFVCPTSIGDAAGLKDRVAEDVRTALEFRPDRVVVTGYEDVAERKKRAGGPRGRPVDLRPS